MMNDLILWCKHFINVCNENQGFISAVLTIMTIVISVIAIITSYKVGNIPYQKKLRVIPCIFQDDGEWVMEIMLINYGLITLVLEGVTIKDAKKASVGSMFKIEPLVLAPTECERVRVSIDDHNGLIEKYALDLNHRITIEVHEYGGDVFKFRKGFPVG